MDAVNLIKILRRMRNEDTWKIYELLFLYSTDSPEDAVASIEMWAKEHPAKTRQSVFLEQWPNAEIDCQDIITIDPCDLDKTIRGPSGNCYYADCDECRLEYWSKDIE